jgi:pyruvate-ferredoxin/flavodoxin oxidoreductase
LTNVQENDEQIDAQRADVAALRKALAAKNEDWAKELDNVADALIVAPCGLLGGDGLGIRYRFRRPRPRHRIRQKRDILVLDTEVYSNTGGQASKATPIGAMPGSPLPEGHFKKDSA